MPQMFLSPRVHPTKVQKERIANQKLICAYEMNIRNNKFCTLTTHGFRANNSFEQIILQGPTFRVWLSRKTQMRSYIVSWILHLTHTQNHCQSDESNSTLVTWESVSRFCDSKVPWLTFWFRRYTTINQATCVPSSGETRRLSIAR